MSGRALSFKQYLGGSDNVQMIEMLPEHQRTFTYNFATDITNYNFSANYSSLVVDELSYNINTGDPNFASSNVIGYVGSTSTTVPVGNINKQNAVAGLVDFTIPKNRYTGPLIPDARTNVVITIMEFTWENTNPTVNTFDSHRWAIIERYSADVTAGNPTSDASFVAITTTGV
tara:strand:+ start:192 stop:710 length:519 start_codon:yes stop_codon:yes gene_type:complete